MTNHVQSVQNPSGADVQSDDNSGQFGQFVREATRYTVASYAILVFLIWVLQWVISEQVSIMGMLKSALQLLLIPSLILLPLCLLLRKWWLSLLLTPVLVAFLFSYGVFFLPRAHAAPANASTVRVMTFNIQAPEEGKVESIVNIIQEADADVVAVPELSTAAAARFDDALAATYPYRALHPNDYGPAGQGILSRYPIVADDYWRYAQNHSSLGHQRVVLEINGQRVVFYSTHPIPPYTSDLGFEAADHTHALRDVLARANSETLPVIILGDFNMTDQFHEYRRITNYYTDAYRAVGDIGFGFTFPHDKWPGVPPLIRLDYIFYSPGWTGIMADVWPRSGSSDHAPLLAQLTLNPQPDEAAATCWPRQLLGSNSVVAQWACRGTAPVRAR